MQLLNVCDLLRKNMKIKEIIKTIRTNFFYKTLYTSFFSLIIIIAFAGYNLYLGIKFDDAFAKGIAIYYVLLIWVKLATLIVEKKIVQKDDASKTIIRRKNYIISSILVFIIDFCLIAPIILMVTNPKEVNFGLSPSIVMAAYCVYKISFAIINYKKSKKSNNLTIILFREINIIEAILSILTLQHTLIMVNSGMNESMRTLSFVTSIGFIGLIILFSILSFLKNKKIIDYKVSQ